MPDLVMCDGMDDQAKCHCSVSSTPIPISIQNRRSLNPVEFLVPDCSFALESKKQRPLIPGDLNGSQSMDRS